MRELPPTARELARRLVAARSAEPMPTLAAAISSLERLRHELEPLVGDIGFRALMSRAVALAKRDADGLEAVTVGPDGSLHGLGEAQRAGAPREGADVAMMVLAHVLGLLITFVGEDLTARLVTKACPETQAPDAGTRDEEKSK